MLLEHPGGEFIETPEDLFSVALQNEASARFF